ncbi:MAG: GMC family oxidoreductase [Deltaproteobacteria bacterium]|nr:GMC family oxidoreductase [Deltaproteobacteria bacterium]
MIFDTPSLRLPMTLDADLCVIGAGPGGAMAAMVAAEAGMRVVVLEAGEFLTPSQFTQREEQMFPRLYWDSASRTTADHYVRIHQGKGVGGSTIHNLNLCKRIPPAVLTAWREERGLSKLPPSTWESLYSEVEALLSVAPIPQSQWNTHNRLLEKGCQVLGWAGGGLSHNRTGCIGSGFCEIGCRYNAKNNALKVVIPRAVAAGAQILASCQVVRVEHGGGRVSAVRAVAVEPVTHRPLGEVMVTTPRACVAASATASPSLLLRSQVPDPSGETGRGLRIHPALVAAGDFQEPVQAWIGIPQAFECVEFLDFADPGGHRTWIVPVLAHPMGVSTMLPGHGEAHRALMSRYAHLGALTAMLHDRTAGTVRHEGELSLRIDYWPNAADRRELMHGLWASVHLLFAAGASRVIVPSSPTRIIERGQAYDDIKAMELRRGLLDVTGVHPMASVPMGDNPAKSAVGSDGKHHHLRGLWLADGSLFPSSIGVPPQLSIYALGLHVGRAIVTAGERI